MSSRKRIESFATEILGSLRKYNRIMGDHSEEDPRYKQKCTMVYIYLFLLAILRPIYCDPP